MILECLQLAVQAPTARNGQDWRWVVVTDHAKRAELARLYAEAGAAYLEAAASSTMDPPTRRVHESALHLTSVLGDVPVHVIPCIQGRVESLPNAGVAAVYGSILPAAWSFMLALRSRGLGSAWTTLHLTKERETADLLGLPYNSVTQVALLPVAYTTGGDFRPATRTPVGDITYWNAWGANG
jgi:nitroreductase